MEIAYLEEETGHELNGTFASKGFTVIIPAYNEEKRISPVLNDLCDFIEKHSIPWKVIVMIDGNDGTSDVVRRFRKKHAFIEYVKTEGRNGKGSAVKHALDLVTSDFVILMDADNSVSVDAIYDNVHHLSDYDVVILSRYESRTNAIPVLRRVISRGFNLILRVFLDLRVYDTQSGYKIVRTEVFKEAMNKVTTTNTFYDVAMLYHINEAQSRILEVPVPYQHNVESTFHPIGEVIGQGVSLFAFIIRHTRLFDLIPASIVDLYYRKFKWM